jgi:hypothetical protein
MQDGVDQVDARQPYPSLIAAVDGVVVHGPGSLGRGADGDVFPRLRT